MKALVVSSISDCTQTEQRTKIHYIDTYEKMLSWCSLKNDAIPGRPRSKVIDKTKPLNSQENAQGRSMAFNQDHTKTIKTESYNRQKNC